jgi:hypothetical protein
MNKLRQFGAPSIIKLKMNNNDLFLLLAFCPRLFQASAAPRLENPDSEEKDAFFGLDTQITILLFR